MTQDLVNERIPDWLQHLEDNNGGGPPPGWHGKVATDKLQLKEQAQTFWKSFYDSNRNRRDAFGEKIVDFELNDEQLPNDAGKAYRSVFHREAQGGFENLARTRRFFQHLTIGKGGRICLNGTHFYLASLLALQPRDNTKAIPSGRYNARRPLLRTIFTTNFDPLLQVSLQLVNLLYYTIDQPDLLQLDLSGEIDQGAIQTVHVHGSIHRPFLANTQAELNRMRDRHTASLAGFFSQHGVIVLGSGGWEDCLTAALQRCARFPYGLYWLGLDEKHLPPPIVDLLNRHAGDAFFVRIGDSSEFAAKLYSALAPDLELPELLIQPLLLLRRELEKIDLGAIALHQIPRDANGNEDDPPLTTIGVTATPVGVLKKNLDLLQQAHEEYFARRGEKEVQAQVAQTRGDADLSPNIQKQLTAQLLRQADLRYSEQKFDAAIDLYNTLIDTETLDSEDLQSALSNRAHSYAHVGTLDSALADFGSLIKMQSTSVEALASTLVDRSHWYSEARQYSKSIEDCSRVISMGGVPGETKAIAMFNRGVNYWHLGKLKAAIKDYTTTIDATDTLGRHRAMALLNRAFCFKKQGRVEEAIRDFEAALTLPEKPEEVVFKAQSNLKRLRLSSEKNKPVISKFRRSSTSGRKDAE